MARPEILTKSFGPPVLEATTSWSLLVVGGVVFCLGSPPEGRAGSSHRGGAGAGRPGAPLCPHPRRPAAWHWRSYFGEKSPRGVRSSGGQGLHLCTPSVTQPRAPRRGLCTPKPAPKPRPGLLGQEEGEGARGAASRPRAVGALAADPAPAGKTLQGPGRTVVPGARLHGGPRPGLPP